VKALRNAALTYADLGWAVLPLRPRSKAPLTRHGKDDATSDLATVLQWWTRQPRANIGLSCGASGFVALDVDPRNGGDDTFAELRRELGELPETVSAKTGGGGEHYLFRHPGGDLVGKAGEGVDVKDSGYILAEPSIHPETGRRYAWDLAPEDVPIAELPARWLSRLRPAVAVRRPTNLAVGSYDDGDLRSVPADVYFPALTGRPVDARGWACCPFHKGGQEKTPSLKVDGTLWSCYACSPLAGKRSFGGNVYDLAALLDGYPIPLRGPDFLAVKGRVAAALGRAS
jgi:hypothetical protein